jgi:hypothetical protein
MNEKNIKRIQCQKCKYYHVTWEINFPNGCRLFEIKSKQMPSLIVYQSIGTQCDKFVEK